MFRRAQKRALRRERLELPDGDFVDLDWSPGENGPIVVLLHGLEGGSRSHYMQGLLREIHKRGWRGVVMHFRGCSGEPNRLARSYHSGDTADFAELVDILSAREPHTPLLAVGFSLGGNVLLKYLGENPEQRHIASAVAVCVPMVLSECAVRLQRGFSRLYQWRLLVSLKNKIRTKFAAMRSPVTLDGVEQCKTFLDFDDLVTAPLHGFKNADDYYRRVSARQFLARIKTPALIIHAIDDPFMTADVLVSPEEISQHVQIEIACGGGHIGFIEGVVPFWPRYWLDKRIADHFTAQIQL